MRLNPDLIRDILLTIEEISDGNISFQITNDESFELLQKYDIKEINYHIAILEDSNFLIGAKEYMDYDNTFYYVKDLSPLGRDYLNSIRDSKSWNIAKLSLKSIGNITLEIIKNVVIESTKSAILSKLHF